MNGGRRGAWVVVLAGLVVAACGAGGGSTGTPSPGGQDVVIGLITVTSGLAGDISGIATRGAQVAIKDVNGRGGILGGRRLKLEVCDNGSASGLTDPQKTVACAARFLQEGLHAVAVTDEGSLSLVKNQLTANHVITIGAYGGSDLDDPRRLPYVFSMVASNETSMGLTVDYIRSRGARRVAELSDTSAPSEALIGVLDARLRAAGITVVDRETFGLSDLDVSAQTSRAIAAHPDLVYVNTYGLIGARVVRDFVDAHSGATILGSAELASTPVPLLLGVGDIPTLRLTTFTSATVRRGERYAPALQHLVDGLRDDGKGPLATGGTIFLAMYGYDIVSLYAHGFIAAGSTEADNVRAALERIHLTRANGEVYVQDIVYPSGHHSPACDAAATNVSFGSVPDANGVLFAADPPRASCS